MYVIINGVSSDTIQGLQVLSLPPITKPKMRRQVDTIDGRDGDIITELGYEAYDRTITVLLHHNYDLDAITAFFNTSGEIIFSNEPDKKYYFRLLEKIDYERAVKFKTANITFHVQPYKYPINETPLTVSSVEWEGTDYDQTPYIFRAVSDSSVEVGNREIIEQITGGTVAWNQAITPDLIRATNTVNGITATKNGDLSITFSGTATSLATAPISYSTPFVQNHIYMLGQGAGFRVYDGYGTDGYGICKWNRASASGGLYAYVPSGTTLNEKFYVQKIDLTQMFGSTIADYIYSLETATAGAGVSLFKSLFPKDYYPYNAGELISVKTSARETTGKNLFNNDASQIVEGATKALVSGNAITNQSSLSWDPVRYEFTLLKGTYRLSIGTITQVSSGATIQVASYDGSYKPLAVLNTSNSSRRFTLTAPSRIRLSLYSSSANNPFTVNYIQLEYGSTATSYEPYQKHTYPLSNIELRGIPKLVNNKITYDGDIYKANGSVTRLYGVRSYQNGDESLTDAITDGTNTVYKLSSPTTESTTPYTETQICDADGTEEFIDDRDVQIPVGHKTKYMQVNDPAEIIVPNAGNVPSAPTIQLTGSGTVGVYLGNAQTLQVNIPEDGITIDTEAQDATSSGQLANRSVTGDYDSVRLQPGDNDVSFSGDFSAVITKYTRWV